MKEPSSTDIVIAGYDLVCPLGASTEEALAGFFDAKSGVNRISRYEVLDTDEVRVSGEVPPIRYEDFDFWNERDTTNWFSPVIFHSMLTVRRALEHACFEVNEDNAHRVATTFSSAVGGLDAMIAAEEKVRQGRLPHPFTNPNGCLNLVAGKVSILTGAKGPIFSPVAACATGAASTAAAAMLLKTGQADAVIAGACDFPVIRSLLASFASMNGAFRSRKPDDRGFDDPARVSRPFSPDRKGFVVSEGSAALIVTTRGYADKHGLPVRATVEGIGMTSDAAHYVAPSFPTIVACIRLAIESASREADEIEVVNAHAASTGVGDAVEAKALREVFGDRALPVCANKSQIGHTMGASSAVELIAAVEGMRRGIVPPTLNFVPDSKLPKVDASEKVRAVEHHSVLSNSFGFGGCNVCLVISA